MGPVVIFDSAFLSSWKDSMRCKVDLLAEMSLSSPQLETELIRDNAMPSDIDNLCPEPRYRPLQIQIQKHSKRGSLNNENPQFIDPTKFK